MIKDDALSICFSLVRCLEVKMHKIDLFLTCLKGQENRIFSRSHVLLVFFPDQFFIWHCLAKSRPFSLAICLPDISYTMWKKPVESSSKRKSPSLVLTLIWIGYGRIFYKSWRDDMWDLRKNTCFNALIVVEGAHSSSSIVIQYVMSKLSRLVFFQPKNLKCTVMNRNGQCPHGQNFLHFCSSSWLVKKAFQKRRSKGRNQSLFIATMI